MPYDPVPRVRPAHVGDGFRAAVAQHFREQAEVARRNQGELLAAGRHASALDGLAGVVMGLDATDSRLIALWRYSSQLASDRLSYHPGPEQKRFVALLGVNVNPPASDECLNELAEAALTDALKLRNDELAEVRDKVGTLEKQVFKAEAVERERDELKETAATLKLKTGNLRGEIEKIRADRDYWRSLAPTEAEKPEPPQAETQLRSLLTGRERRKSVEGQQNIYRSEARDGSTVYEVGWRDEGKQRWHTVGPDFEEAIGFRDQLEAEGKIKVREAVA